MNGRMALLAGASLCAGLFGAAGAQAAETLRIGLEASYPPFESKTAAGALTGFDIDVGNAVCKRMKVKCVWVENAFDGLIPALSAKKFDVINSAMNITEKRRQSIDFTAPIYHVPSQMIARRDAHLQPTVQSLKGKSVGVLQGSIQEDYVRKHWAGAGVNVVAYPDQSQIYPDLVHGRLDAAVQEAPTAVSGFLSKAEGRDFDFAGGPLVDTATLGVGVGFGLRKDDAVLRKRIEQAIAALKTDGTLKRLSVHYFKSDIITP